MAFFSSLSQRCILVHIGRTLKQKAVHEILLSASAVGCLHLHEKNYSSYVKRTPSEHSTLLLYSWKYGSRITVNLPKLTQFMTFFSKCASNETINHKKLWKTRDSCHLFSLLRHVHSGIDPKEKRELVKELREEKIFTIPNILSFGRIVATPFLGYLVLSENHMAALLLFIVAGITDMLDGFIARRYPSQMSYIGSVLDPIADKFLVGVLTIVLSVVHLIPVPLAVVILGRDVGLILSSFVVRYITLPQPRTFSRFFDVQLPTVEVTPSTIGKLNTVLQLALIASSLTAPVLDFTGHTGLTALQYLVGLTTVVSGVDYMISGRGVNILTKNNRNTP